MPTAKERRELEKAECARKAKQLKAQLPKQLLMLMGWARRIGVESYVETEARLDHSVTTVHGGDIRVATLEDLILSPGNDAFFCVHFICPERRGQYTDLYVVDERFSLGNESEEWAVLSAIRTLQDHETFLIKEQEALEVARAGYDALTAEQRRALGLKHRP